MIDGQAMRSDNLCNHGQKVKCDCCGNETMAEIREDKIIIMDRRHGKKHFVVLTLRDILDKMKRLISDK